MLAWFKRDFPEWDAAWHELFKNDATLFLPRPQYCMPLDQTWQSLPDLTMLGDAAHLMPPYAGEGVNMAMLDALKLSECLLISDYENVKAAITHYENQMSIRVAEAAKMSLENTDWMHSENAINKMLEMFNL